MTIMTTDNFDTLDEMREQMDVLRSKLDSQTMTNERLMRRVMSQSYASIEGNFPLLVLCALFVIAFFTWYLACRWHASWPLVAFTVVFFTASFGFSVANHHILNARHFLTEDVHHVALRMRRLRQLRHAWNLIGGAAAVVFVVWMTGETVGFGLEGHNWGLVGTVLGIVFGIIGIAIGRRKYNRTMREIDEQLKELTGA